MTRYIYDKNTTRYIYDKNMTDIYIYYEKEAKIL